VQPIQIVYFGFLSRLKNSHLMNQSLSHYRLQTIQAVETIAMLERKLNCVKNMLEENPDNTFLLRELAHIELEMTITINEHEHILEMIKQSTDVVQNAVNTTLRHNSARN
jgi:hypothetical protein